MSRILLNLVQEVGFINTKTKFFKTFRINDVSDGLCVEFIIVFNADDNMETVCKARVYDMGEPREYYDFLVSEWIKRFGNKKLDFFQGEWERKREVLGV